MIKFDDKFFQKIFIALITLAIMLVFILSIHLFLDEPINSTRLWVAGLLPFLTINLIEDINGKWGKIIILFVSIIAMILFFRSMLEWSFTPSLLGASVMMILSVLLYMTFVG